MIIKINTILLFSLLLNSVTNAQSEMLTGLDYNYILQKQTNGFHLKSAYVSAKPDTLIQLPLIDDFAQSGIFPDTGFWSSGEVFINNGYCIKPVTIGVATFDALDNDGKIHENATLEGVFEGDELVSNRIDLSVNHNNVFLSFYYQPGGNGEIPDEQDSLVLQFRSNSITNWKTVWKAVNFQKDSVIEMRGEDSVIWKPGTYTNTLFKEVILPVNDTSFFNTGFKFRFVNYISFQENEVYEGRIGNADIWNLDYVRLDNNRNINDTLINDLAFTNGLDSVLQNYTSVPAKHFIPVGLKTEWRRNPYFELYNGYNQTQFFSRLLEIKDITNGTKKTSDNDLNDTIKGLSVLGLKDELPGSFTDIFDNIAETITDSAFYRIKYILETGNDDRKENDTISSMLELTHFYSYDDGSPEMGYGLIGQGTENARVAVRFTPYKGDILRGVYIFFNRPYNDVQTVFNLAVWDEIEVNNQTHPNDTLFTQEEKTKFEDGINQFIPFQFKEPVFMDEPFYIGWVQFKPEFLNVGFDVNRNNNQNNFVNFGNQWQQSSLNGTLMIRPVFSEKPIQLNSETAKKEFLSHINIYPNPVNDWLYIEYAGYERMIEYSVSDIQGRIIKTGETTIGNIDCSEIKPGIYLFKFSWNNKTEIKKVLIAR